MSENIGFSTGISRLLPPLACIGQIPVDQMAQVKLTESGAYYNMRFTIEGASGASKTLQTNFLFHPEWFEPGFDPKTIEQLEVSAGPGESLSDADIKRARNGRLMMHRRMFGTRSSLGQLQGMCGTEEGLAALVKIRDKMWAEKKTDHFAPEDVEIMVKTFLAEHAPVVGYILKQEREATGQFDEAGKAKYEPIDRYGVEGWFYTSASEIARLVKSAEKRAHLPGAMKVAFEVS